MLPQWNALVIFIIVIMLYFYLPRLIRKNKEWFIGQKKEMNHCNQCGVDLTEYYDLCDKCFEADSAVSL